MKVLHVCYSDNLGGAFIGAHRLHSCMVATGVDSELLVIKKRTNDPRVIPAPFLLKLQNLAWRNLSRLILKLQGTPDTELRTLEIFPSMTASIINRHPADIVQFHWINMNTVGIRDFRKINKPMVWKLPDMWAFCGSEHYTDDTRYVTGYTPANRPPGHRGLDLDRYIWEQKSRHWKNLDLAIVSPSKWLADCARRSSLLGSYPVHNIPNPINTDVFKPATDLTAARVKFNLPPDKRLILFSSMSKTTYARKGFHYLEECLRIFSTSVDKSLYRIVFMGYRVPASDIHGIEVINLGSIMDMNEVAQAYACMDVTIVPSVADNLPNVIKESMACGVPCVSFDAGGIPDMISHKVNGYLAPPGDSKGLAEGLKWISDQDTLQLCRAARISALELHGHERIVNQYLDLYGTCIRKQGSSFAADKS